MQIGGRSVSGKVRELEDANARVDIEALRDLLRGRDQADTRLDKVLQHDALYAEYPELRYVPLTVSHPANQALEAYWSPAEHRMGITWSELDDILENDQTLALKITGVLLHETQHCIQQIENLPAGSSTALWEKAAERLVKEQPQLLDALMQGLRSDISDEALGQTGFRQIAASVAYLRGASDGFRQAMESGAFSRLNDWQLKERERCRRVAMMHVAHALYLHDPGELQARQAEAAFLNGVDPAFGKTVDVTALPDAPESPRRVAAQFSNFRFALTRLLHQAMELPGAAMSQLAMAARSALNRVEDLMRPPVSPAGKRPGMRFMEKFVMTEANWDFNPPHVAESRVQRANTQPPAVVIRKPHVK